MIYYTPSMEIATFGGGCFWCTNAIFKRVRGVIRVETGYSGGTTANPSESQVHEKNTGHAEVIQIQFDPAVIGYKKLVEIFFLTHDPTSLNKQDYDVGPQYRSVIFFHNVRQHKEILEVKKYLENKGVFTAPIVTEIVKFEKFYKAASHHQDYYDKNSFEPYCQVIINPKIGKLREKFAPLLKDG